jgi:hypothetical protein
MKLSTSLSDGFFRKYCPDPTVMYDLGDLYAEFNSKYFDGELCIAQYASWVDADGESRRKYGHLKLDGRLSRRTLGMYKPTTRAGKGTIVLNRKIASDPNLTRSVLLHEMIHKFLDAKGMTDGVKGHGPNFLAEACRINNLCLSQGVEHRVHFMGEEITQEEPSTFAVLLDREIGMGKDLDIADRMKSVMKTAFDTKYTYAQ